jgi:hypothetical protein
MCRDGELLCAVHYVLGGVLLPVVLTCLPHEDAASVMGCSQVRVMLAALSRGVLVLQFNIVFMLTNGDSVC